MLQCTKLSTIEPVASLICLSCYHLNLIVAFHYPLTVDCSTADVHNWYKFFLLLPVCSSCLSDCPLCCYKARSSLSKIGTNHLIQWEIWFWKQLVCHIFPKFVALFVTVWLLCSSPFWCLLSATSLLHHLIFCQFVNDTGEFGKIGLGREIAYFFAWLWMWTFKFELCAICKEVTMFFYLNENQL